MPINEVDEAIDRIASPAAPAPDPVADAIDRIAASSATRVKQSLLSSQDLNPEQEAEARRLGLKFGVPSPVVSRQMDQFRRREAVDKPFDQIAFETPATSTWLEEPANLAVAKDDLENLGFLEWVVTAPQRAFAQGVNQIRHAQLRSKQLRGEAMTEFERDMVEATKRGMTEGGELGAANSWFRGAVTGGARLLTNVIGGAEYAAKYSAALGTGGALGGFLATGPVGAAAGAAAGGAVGAVLGAYQFGVDLEAGLAYDEFLDFKVNGKPIDPEAAKMAALAAGYINGGLELVQIERLLSTIPGVDKLKGAVTRGAIKQALRSPTIVAALSDAGKTYAGTLGIEASTEAAQRAITVMSGELGKVLSGQAGVQLSAGDVAAQAGQEFVGALQAFALMPLPGMAMQVSGDVQRANRAKGNAAFFDNLAQGVKQSKTAQRSPDAAMEFLAQATKDGPLETLYVPTEQWRTYWQSQGIDPAQMAEEVTGKVGSFEQAEDSGNRLEIPTARYAVKLAATDHHAALAPELSVGPEEMSLREATEFLEAQKQLLKAAQEPATTERQERFESLVQQLVSAGLPEETARKNAAVYEAFESLGRRADVDLGYELQVARSGMMRPGAEEGVAPAPAAPREGVVPPEGVAPAPPAEAAQPAVAEEVLAPTLEDAFEMERRRAEPAAPPEGIERRTVDGRAVTMTAQDVIADLQARGVIGQMDVDAPLDVSSIGPATLRMFSEDPTFASRLQEFTERARNIQRQKAPPRGAPAEAGVDIAAEPAQTAEDVAAAEGTRPEDGEVGRVSISRIEASTPESRRESPTQRNTRRAQHYASVFRALSKAAKQLDPQVDVKAVRQAFNERIAFLEEADDAWRASGENPRTVLQAIAAAGGISVDFETKTGGMGGELRWVKDSPQFGPFGSFAGVRGVFQTHTPGGAAQRRTGLGLDEIATRLAQDERFSYIEGPKDLFAILEDVARLSEPLTRTVNFPGTEELRKRAGIDPRVRWWLPETELSQDERTLFDQLETPTEDVLDTGEVQPRLPGAEGVREEERPTPEIEAPFTLTSEIATRKGKQQTLFQAARGVTAVEDTAALDAMLPFAQAGSFARRRDLKVAMQKRVLDAAESADVNLDPSTPEGHAYLVGIGLRDVLTSLQSNANAVGWYDEKTRQALAVAALVYPELNTDENARFAFTFALAVHSNGVEVNKNFELAAAAYEGYRNTGKMPTNLGIGPSRQQMKAAAELFNEKVEQWGLDTFRQFMNTQFTRSEIIRLGLEVDGELATEVVRGAAVIGPKIGNGFFANLNGFFDALTMDRWLVRTWGRWTGELFYDTSELVPKKRAELKAAIARLVRLAPAQARAFGQLVDVNLAQVSTAKQLDRLGVAIRKSSTVPANREIMASSKAGDEVRRHGNMLGAHLDGQKEAPANPVERQQMRAVFADILAESQQIGYTGMTTADLQALLWYAEKRLYDAGTSEAEVSAGFEQQEAPDYANAASKLARSKGIDQAAIDDALASEARQPAGAAPVSAGAGGRDATATGAEAVGAGRAGQGPSRGFTPEAREAFLGRYARAASGRARFAQLTPTLEQQPTELFQGAYHGSPHVFEKFSLQAIGSGEGAQVYGWGLYFASLREVAEGYRDRLSSATADAPNWKLNGEPVARGTDLWQLASALEQAGKPLGGESTASFLNRAIKALEDQATFVDKAYGGDTGTMYRVQARALRAINPEQLTYQTPGRVYKVEIPEDADFLDWDKPMAEQSPKVKAALVQLGLKMDDYVVPSPSDAMQQINDVLNSGTLAPGSVRRERLVEGSHIVLQARLDNMLGNDDAPSMRAFRAWWLKNAEIVSAWGTYARRPITGEEIYKELMARGHELAGAAFEKQYGFKSNFLQAVGPGGAAKAASQALAAAGVAGIRYLDGFSRQKGEGSSNYVVFDDKLVEITEFYQPVDEFDEQPAMGTPPLEQGKGEKRGSIRFGPGLNKRFDINLFAKADLSTFLHETGHLFLEVFGDTIEKLQALDPETLTESQRKVLTDYQSALTFLGVESRDQITAEHHEKWARAFEAYLFEGKAPSIELRSAFASFRAWLVGIYRSLRALDVEMTDEVRRVFDRLLATDEQIEAAQAQGQVTPLFLTAQEAGMDPQRFELYRQRVAEVSAEAKEKLQAQMLADVVREQTALWKARREEVRVDVQADVYNRPVYLALSAMQRGTYPDGTPLGSEDQEPVPLKLSRQAIVDQFGKARLAVLPRPYIYTRDGGITPDMAAEQFGFSSGDELLTVVSNAPPMNQVIEAEVDARMIAEYGSILTDGTMVEKANAALANEARESVIRIELRALGEMRRLVDPIVRKETARARREERAAGDYEARWAASNARLEAMKAANASAQEIAALEDEVANLKRKAAGGPATMAAAVPPQAVITETARQSVARTKVRDLKPATYWNAARRASRTATDAAAKQDFDKAILAKQQELLNLALYRAASDAVDDADKRAKGARDLSKPSIRKKLGLVDQTFLDQIDGILARYEFAEVTNRTLEQRASLRKWVAAMEAEGLPVELADDIIDDSREINYRELPYEELVGITDALKHITHLARIANRQQATAEATEFAATRDGITASIYANNKVQPVQLEPGQEERKRGIADWFASHTKIATLARRLDGHSDGGQFWQHFIRPLNKAADDEQVRKRAAGEAFRKIINKHYSGRELTRWRDKVHIPAINNSLSKEGRIAVALNWGNATSRERLLNDPRRRWNQQQIDAILATLDGRDWQFVQDTWDYVDSFWPEIKAKQERVVGIAPEKVEATPVITPFGILRGGYYPLAYDGRLSVRAGWNEAASEAKLATAAAYVRSTTKRGHTEKRLENVKLSVRLEVGVVFDHLDQVIHDLSHHEALLETTRLLRDPKISTAILETQGDVVYQQFTRALQDIAIGHAIPRNRMDKAAVFMRSGTQIALLGWNLWTGAQQPLGLFNGMSRVGVKWVARGMKRWLRDAVTMESTVKWVHESSAFMRERHNTATQDIAQLREGFRRPGGWFDKLARQATGDLVTQQHIVDSFLWHIALMQRVADIPTWVGAYEKAKASGREVDDATAAAIADQAVIDSQGSGQIKDLSEVQRGGAIAKLFMTFYTYGATIFNETSDRISGTEFRSLSSLTQLLGHLSLLYVAPAVATVALANAVGKREDEDEEAWLVAIGAEILSTALNTMVLVREFGGLLHEGTRGYAGPAGARAIELGYRVGNQVKQGEFDEALFKAINAAAGVLFRYPAAQVERTVDGVVALEEGRTKNPSALLFGPPPRER